MGVWTHQWTTLRNLVQLLIRIGSWESAAVLSGAINAHRAEAQAFGAEGERMRSATERIADRLGPSKWSEANGRGASMSDQDTVTFACETIDQPPRYWRNLRTRHSRIGGGERLTGDHRAPRPATFPVD